MGQPRESHSCLVTWRGQKFKVEMNQDATLKDLGDHLQKVTNVKADTLRLLVSMGKSSTILYPFSDQHSGLSLEAASVLEGKAVRMMGVLDDEVNEVLQNAKVDHRIAGFDEEANRLMRKIPNQPYSKHKLPQGPYIFCDFRTLSLPGVELNPPASKALDLLHTLASDPGIVAIMNKHHWRVGILTEMAPIGYVGVNPRCILGLNKNHGEEISLRLRTDDLHGFRKYESIKKTLLHELAHMVYSEHDANFYALDSQLNKEAATLDWTKSKGHTLTGSTHRVQFEEEFDINRNATSSQKLGGQTYIFPNAIASSVSAAYQRLANSSSALLRSSALGKFNGIANSGVFFYNQNVLELDNDVDYKDESLEIENNVKSGETHAEVEADPDNSQVRESLSPHKIEGCEEPNHNVSSARIRQSDPGALNKTLQPGRDDSEADNYPRFQKTERRDQLDSLMHATTDIPRHVEPEQNYTSEVTMAEPDSGETSSRSQIVDSDSDDPKLQIIQDTVTILCDRLQNAIHLLRNEVNPSEAGVVLHILTKIIRNVIEHPNELKFKKLRKANQVLQKNIVRYKAAMDILTLIGFCEDVMDENGKAENFLVLKRNDPGLLWLAKSTIETYIAL
ncbi:hypothetical protein F511_16574 [Dorcoceras hygrometricum]|uniref:WLM domain-containing protein n=1 Tax=Dorcoceras hygrometricum TaxID=472368 RepID=A0A2Z7B982_9LAMI|nr:hypothetical protein F511_16574 [Dorcoceras hygrometricum]